MIRHKIESVTSTKTALFVEKMNNAIKKLEDEGCIIFNITSNISYSGKEGYMLNGMITYIIEENTDYELSDVDIYDYGIDFGTGMSIDGGPIPKA